MQELFELCLIAYVGMTLHLLKKYNEARKRNGFTDGGFIKDQLIPTVGTVITVPFGLYLIIDNPGLSELFPLTSLTAAGFGYVGQSVILSFLDGKFKPKKDETVD